MPVEMARMLLAGLVDNGLAAAASTIECYGSLRGRGSNFEEALGHALMRPESIVPMRSGIELHTGAEPYGLLTTVSADGAKTMVYGDIAEPENIERLVSVSGAALYSIAQEIAGMSPADVDALLEGAKPTAAAVK
jgi:hypothetical protein